MNKVTGLFLSAAFLGFSTFALPCIVRACDDDKRNVKDGVLRINLDDKKSDKKSRKHNNDEHNHDGHNQDENNQDEADSSGKE